MRKFVIYLLIAVLAASAFLFLVEGPDPITKKVKHLTVEQNEFDLIITWDEMNCDGYDLTIIQDDQRTLVTTPDNEYTIHYIIL